MKNRIILLGALLLIVFYQFSLGQNFTTGGNAARLYGIHEVTLTGADLPAASIRYSKFPEVSFVNGETTINVNAFYDGV